MTELILHHYDLSPYAEKIRLVFGLKNLPWRSVQAPMVMPKPDYVELTGGYRRVPALQLGADIYCDTHCIARVLDRLHPEPPLSPPGLETVEHGLSHWAESSFMLVIYAFFGIGGIFPEEFVEDRRQTMLPPGTNLDAAALLLPTKLLQIRANLDRLEGLLSDGRTFLLGESACLADLSAYHPLMGLGVHERTGSLLRDYERVRNWIELVRGLGHGKRSELEPADAIAIAREATPAPFEGEPVLPDGIALGDPVLVVDDDYGSGNVTGTLAASDLHEITIHRTSERAGELVVHFPREGYSLLRAG